jgi:hypothetical protein
MNRAWVARKNGQWSAEAKAERAEAKRRRCPGRLALCGVPCGCAGDNPSHYPPANSASPQSAPSAHEAER